MTYTTKDRYLTLQHGLNIEVLGVEEVSGGHAGLGLRGDYGPFPRASVIVLYDKNGNYLDHEFIPSKWSLGLKAEIFRTRLLKKKLPKLFENPIVEEYVEEALKKLEQKSH